MNNRRQSYLPAAFGCDAPERALFRAEVCFDLFPGLKASAILEDHFHGFQPADGAHAKSDTSNNYSTYLPWLIKS